MARRQHGVLTRRDLEGLGFSRKAIEHRVASGRLRLVSRGVYAVGRLGLSRKGRWMAAVLASGPAAALSHSSAAALLGIGVERAGGVDVSIRRTCRIQRPGIRARSRPSLPERDIVVHEGIPVTSPVRTLIDRAPLRELLDRQTFRLSDTDLEVLFRPIVREAGLPTPLTKEVVNGFEPEHVRRVLALTARRLAGTGGG